MFVLRHGVLYGEGEFADGFLGVMRAAWEGRSVPVFGAGDNVLRLCHARKLAEGVVRVAARALLGVVMRSDGAESGPSSQAFESGPTRMTRRKRRRAKPRKAEGRVWRNLRNLRSRLRRCHLRRPGCSACATRTGKQTRLR